MAGKLDRTDLADVGDARTGLLPAPGGQAVPVIVTVFLVTLVFYLRWLPGTAYWLDSPEFMTAAAALGLAHPPGHPVVAILMKLASLLPLGDVPFRLNLVGAILGAIAAGLTGGIASVVAQRVLIHLNRDGRTGRLRHASTLVGVAGGLLYGLGASSMIQAMAAEVYTLNAALVLGSVYLLISSPDGTDARRTMAAAVLMGLAFANHHLLAFLAGPAVLVAAFRSRRDTRTVIAAAVTACLVAVCCYLYLWVRSAAGAWPTWFPVSDPAGFFWYVSASIFSQSLGGFEQSGGGIGQNLALASVVAAGSLGVAGVVLSLGGAWLCARSGAAREIVVLLLLAAGGFGSKVMMGILDPSNPDDHGYFLTALAATAVLAASFFCLPMAAGGGRAGRVVRGIASSLLAAMVVAVIPAGIDVGRDRSHFDHTRRVSRLVWSDVPSGSVVLVSHYPVFFLMQYQQIVEGARPDVSLVQQSLYYKARGGQWYAREMTRRDADLAGLMDGFQATSQVSWPALETLASRRPVLLDPSPDFAAPLDRVSFAGWFFSVSPSPVEPPSPTQVSFSGPGTHPVKPTQVSFSGGEPAVDNGVDAHLLSIDRVLGRAPLSNVETRRVVTWNLVSAGDWLKGAGYVDAASELYFRAAYYNPEDRSIRGRLGTEAGDR